LFAGYQPLYASGVAAAHAVAFDRGADAVAGADPAPGAVAVATRLPARLAAAGGWGDTELPLSGAYVDALTGQAVSGSVRLAELLEHYPVALLLPS
jgi:(1->4)-alpha-D-glucan 1-alpha-D-glucosylmutase